jgi:hypothetical protein
MTTSLRRADKFRGITEGKGPGKYPPSLGILPDPFGALKGSSRSRPAFSAPLERKGSGKGTFRRFERFPSPYKKEMAASLQGGGHSDPKIATQLSGLVPILSLLFLALVRRYLLELSLPSAGHFRISFAKRFELKHGL